MSAIAARIGRRPKGVLGVVRRCQSGAPQVIITDPVQGEEIFPTLFWLTCPALQRVVGSIEADGWVTRLTEKAQEDATFRREVQAVHLRAASLRRRVAGESALDRLKETQPSKHKVIVETGVAGIRSRVGVKCLHAHLADHLALGRNPIGAVTLELLRDRGIDPMGCPI